MSEFNFEVACCNCRHEFKYGSRAIIIECGYEGVRCPKCGNWIYHSNDNTPNHLELWIARYKDSSLWLYYSRPIKMSDGSFRHFRDIPKQLASNFFPEVTWENSPKKVRLELSGGFEVWREDGKGFDDKACVKKQEVVEHINVIEKLEVPVGEVFEYEGGRYQCREAGEDCDGCAFNDIDCNTKLLCSKEYRADKKNVIFIREEGGIHE